MCIDMDTRMDVPVRNAIGSTSHKSLKTLSKMPNTCVYRRIYGHVHGHLCGNEGQQLCMGACTDIVLAYTWAHAWASPSSMATFSQ